ncbi:hypothetical protein [Planctopirus ephydatiae]|nr:hypothetical protein [Planctopirus ephydatiae]
MSYAIVESAVNVRLSSRVTGDIWSLALSGHWLYLVTGSIWSLVK